MTIALAILASFAIPAAILLGFLLWDSFEKFAASKLAEDSWQDIAHGDCFPTIPECRSHEGELR